MTMVDVNAKIENWKNRLLDLGKRNRLLNYRETKRSSLQILSPECFELYRSFVQDEQPLVFPNIFEMVEIGEDGDEKEIDYPIKTNQSPKETQRTLKYLRDKAKTALEEQGVNILYLSFGFLKWTESQNSEYWFNSPLLLVPVSLTIESITAPYILSLHEDEMVINPTLAFKFENDFGITLPKYNEENDLHSILEEIAQLTRTNTWKVVPEISLSLLSFLKINMYNDLNKHKDSITSNPIIRTISGDASCSKKIPEEISNFDHDKNTTPLDMFQVVDADSSQQDAILCAKKGISFVLQGPPGTGKSQTITNIIAECLADGKKVLFVSEKMAALEVVHRRLTIAGLDEFCLILHSYKANKRAILDQLEITLKLAQQKATLSDEAFQKLELLLSNKERLNEYANQVFETVMPLGKSIYQVNGIIANLEEYDNVIFPIDDLENIDSKKFNRFINHLKHLTNTIGKMTDDYRVNPWYGTIIPFATHELRYDLEHKLGKLIPKLEDSQKQLSELYSKLSLEWNITYQGIIDIIPIISIAAEAPQVPVSWILGNDIEPLYDEIAECEALKSLFWETHSELSQQYSTISANDEEVILSSPNELQYVELIAGEINALKSILANRKPYSGINSDYNAAQELSIEAQDKAKQLKDIISNLTAVYEETVFAIDYNGILMRYKTEYTSFLKIFKKNYRADKKLIKGQCREITKKISDPQVLELVAQLRTINELKQWFVNNRANFENIFGNLLTNENSDFSKIEKYKTSYLSLVKSLQLLEKLKETAAKLEESEKTLIAHYQFLYKGFNTDWENIRLALIWAASFRKKVEQLKVNTEFVEFVCTGKYSSDTYKGFISQAETILNNLNFEFLWFLGLFENQEYYKLLKLPALQDRLLNCKNGIHLLEEWIDFRTAREKCREEGLTNYITEIEKLHIEASKIIPVFKKRFFRLWLDTILPNYPAVQNFRRKMHENTIEEFASLDKIQFDIAKARIRSKLINDLPSLQRFTNGVDEISILKRELGKQRRIMPIRKLFLAIPNLLLTLKPCLMMSPLSVSLFLEAETYQFDTVIFDEASQVCTENAIGAISRGKQVIIAGDSKQLPPTNFFSASISSDGDYDTDEDEYDDIGAYESVLDEAGFLPERTLLWHYRSRHEHLIAFSNAKIYKNNLITFPANVNKIPDNGVEYVYVHDGFYDRGGKKGNVNEARKIAELVFDHFEKYPNRSLGVIAFGEVQQLAIDTAIRVMRLENQNFESFFKEDKDEPFFIKNLENVQGDERDTIIFSIGYAKDSAGVFRMNFGPLSKSGGERRLNVAITRAKYNVKLVGSIMPTDIDVDRISSDGPKLLRAYIDFAINGEESLISAITEYDVTEHDSPFEEAVYNFLDRKGYKVATQVGCSGYRIDMAVKHPNLSGIYVLGVECDGAAYHSARTARERDRLRQEVLENMGWNIYRIWSTDWIKDPIAEGEKLIAAINNALTNFDDSQSVETIVSAGKDDTDEFVSLDMKSANAKEQDNPYGFADFVKTDFSVLPRNGNGQLELTDCIVACVHNEYPIHYELLCQRLAPLFGNEKATVKVRREVDYVMRFLHGQIFKEGDFIFPVEWKKINICIPNNRKINHISTAELAEAMNVILKTLVGCTREGLCLETTRVYGWQRMTKGINASMNAACDLLINQGKAKEIEGKIVLQNS